MASALGEKIRTLRKAKKYSLQELGDVSNTSKSYLWELENRDPPRPSGEKLAVLAKALDVTIDYLLDQEVGEPDEHVKDRVFFRNFQKLPENERERVRQMVAAWAKMP